MDIKLRRIQEKTLRIFSKRMRSFALTGGTALELYYLHHRFSADLDFFSPRYDLREMEALVAEFNLFFGKKLKFENEFVSRGRAKVRFYTAKPAGLSRPLKIDFVEDVLFERPDIKVIGGLRVYSAESIYLQKIAAASGVSPELDETGRMIMKGGRNEARDVFDLYMLSRKVKPLHEFLKGVSRRFQRGMVHWYRTFSRHDFKVGLLDLDIYDTKTDSKVIIKYLEGQIEKLIKGTVGLDDGD